MKIENPDLMIARRLAAVGAHMAADDSRHYWLHARGLAAPSPVPAATVRRLLARGAVEADSPGHLVLSDAGRMMVRRLLADPSDLRTQHQTRTTRVLEDGHGDRRPVSMDLGESPLAWLRARKGKDGQPMVDAPSFEAGERLRADFTRGQLMPRVTANWSLAGTGGRRSGAGGIGDLTDAALSARLRVEKAVTALGPELSGTVLDFCCFLKGIEDIERERRWPKRSARLVLQLGLSALARHYGLSAEAIGSTDARRVRQWGAEGYRPAVDG
jgi:hypothetical protein